MIGGIMQIVTANEEHQREGFTAAVELDESDIKNLTKVLKEGTWKEIKEVILGIINFATREGHRMSFIQDDDGDDSLLLEIRGKQWVTDAEIPGIRNSLNFILIDHLPV